MVYRKAVNLPEEKKNAEIRAMIETYGKQADFTDYSSLEPILQELSEINEAAGDPDCFREETMEFYEAVNARQSVRQFTDEAIPVETLKRIVEAGYKAPANDHFRDWHYIVVTDKEIMKQAVNGVPKNLTVRDVESMTFISDPVQKKSYQIAVPLQYRMLTEAAALIIPLMKKKTDILHPASLSDLNCYASIWCSIENIWLAAAAEGYGCNVRIPLGNEESIAREALGFPDSFMIPCFIGIGRPRKDAVPVKQLDVRIEEQIHWNHF